MVYDCCRELGIIWESARYVILGDDILFGDSELAQAYRMRLLSLGVSVSLEKTLVSNDTFEFAKRWFHKGEEITPFPVSAVIDTYKSVPLLVSALYGEQRRGLIPRSGIPGAVESLYSRLGYRRKICSSVGILAKRCILSAQFSDGTLGAAQFISELLGGPQSVSL